MARANPDNFSIHTLTRTDTLYFAMTVFSTVGFGDIAPTSQVARILVTVQMALNLILLGLGVRLLTQAVHMGVGRRQAESRPADPTTPGI
jgi:voltage-gated potassium channel